MEGNGHNCHPKAVKVGKNRSAPRQPRRCRSPPARRGISALSLAPRASQYHPGVRDGDGVPVTQLPEDSASRLDRIKSRFEFCQLASSPVPGTVCRETHRQGSALTKDPAGIASRLEKP